jgi:hypothetical protein
MKLPPPKPDEIRIVDTTFQESPGAVATINDQRHQIAGLKGQVYVAEENEKSAKILQRESENKSKERLSKEWIHWVIMIGEAVFIILLLVLLIRSFGGIKLK